MTRTGINPFYAARIGWRTLNQIDGWQNPVYARLPPAPRNASPVPHLSCGTLTRRRMKRLTKPWKSPTRS